MEDMFIRFDTIHERDRHRDRHSMTAKAARLHSIARQKLLTRCTAITFIEYLVTVISEALIRNF